jgi:Brp/Blh family beta-carotene 15,15'-monooxygenase
MMRFGERYYSPVFLSATTLFIVLTAVGVPVPREVIIGLLVVGVVLFGLPHGAIDPLVAKQAMGNLPFYSRTGFYVVYSLIALLYGVVWWCYPAATLASFLVISGFHFGEDWEGRFPNWTRLSYGAAVVTLPMLFHSREVMEIYSALGASDAGRFVIASQAVALIAAPIAVFSALIQWRHRTTDLLEIVAIVGGALVLHPLLFFVCYFCLLHSPRHLFETARATGVSTAGELVRAALPALILSVAGGLVFWVSLPPGTGDDRILRVIFIGLAALTIPHMILAAVAHRLTFDATPAPLAVR